jgi:hypothetical protein
MRACGWILLMDVYGAHRWVAYFCHSVACMLRRCGSRVCFLGFFWMSMAFTGGWCNKLQVTIVIRMCHNLWQAAA